MAQVTLHLDFETASRVDLKEKGLHNYATDPSTRVLMLAWAINDALPQMWFPHECALPEHLELMVRRPEIQKAAFNATFERTIFRDVLHIETPASAWSDPMISARYASVAGSLEFVGKVLGLSEDKAKLATGKKLVKLFCEPNKRGAFNDWTSHPEEWAQFVDYCRQDIIASREISYKLKAFSLPPTERRVYQIDQDINARGIPVDVDFVTKADKIVSEERDTLLKEFRTLTGLENPNSTKQLLGWLKTKNYPYNSLGAKWITKALEISRANATAADGPSQGERGLELRQLLAKSSLAKLEALKNLTSADGRLRNQFVYGGAARTLRWSGRGFQPQNLQRPTIKDITGATLAILTGDREEVRKFGPPLDVVASCMRGALCAPKGKHFVVCDLGSIETRVSAWIAECLALLGVFEDGRDPYIEFGTKLFAVPYEQINKQQRQLAKPAVLGACYGLGAGKDDLDENGDDIRTGLYGYAAGMGQEITQEFAKQCVDVYRQSYPEIPAAWRKLEKGAILAVQTGLRHSACKVLFDCVRGKLLYITLPSGRRLHYIRPRVEAAERWDGAESNKLTYENQIIGSHWGRTHTFGGKILENIVQAVSRDILAHGMVKATEEGFTIVMHAHDELVCLEDVGSVLNVERLRACMTARPTWASDLPLDAAGFAAQRYKKD